MSSLVPTGKKKGAADASLLINAIRQSVEASSHANTPAGTKVSQPNPLSIGAGRASVSTLRGLLAYETAAPAVYGVTSNVSLLTPGSPIVFTVTTRNVPRGTRLYWTMDGSTLGGDFVDDTASGSFVIQESSARIQRVLKTTDVRRFDSYTSFTLQIRTDNSEGPVVATSSSISVSPLGTAPVYGLSCDQTILDTDLSATTVAVMTTNVADGTTLYWTTDGTATASDFTDGKTSGTVTITNGEASIVRAATVLNSFNLTFTLSLRTGSVSGPVVATSPTVTILGSIVGNLTSSTDAATAPPTPALIGAGGAPSSASYAFMNYPDPGTLNYGYAYVIDFEVEKGGNVYVLMGYRPPLNTPFSTTIPIYSYSYTISGEATSTLWANYDTGGSPGVLLLKYDAYGTPVWMSGITGVRGLALATDGVKTIYNGPVLSEFGSLFIYCADWNGPGSGDAVTFLQFAGVTGTTPNTRKINMNVVANTPTAVASTAGRGPLTPVGYDSYIVRYDLTGKWAWFSRMSPRWTTGLKFGFLNYHDPLKCFTADANGNTYCVFSQSNNSILFYTGAEPTGFVHFYNSISSKSIGNTTDLTNARSAIYPTAVRVLSNQTSWTTTIAKYNINGVLQFTHTLTPTLSNRPLSRTLTPDPLFSGGIGVALASPNLAVVTMKYNSGLSGLQTMCTENATTVSKYVVTKGVSGELHAILLSGNGIRGITRLVANEFASNSVAVDTLGNIVVAAPTFGPVTIQGLPTLSLGNGSTVEPQFQTQATLSESGTGSSIVVFNSNATFTAGTAIRTSVGFADVTSLLAAGGNVYATINARSSGRTLRFANFSGGLGGANNLLTLSDYGYADTGSSTVTTGYLTRYDISLRAKWVSRFAAAPNLSSSPAPTGNVNARLVLPRGVVTSPVTVYCLTDVGTMFPGGFGLQYLQQYSVSTVSLNGSNAPGIIFRDLSQSKYNKFGTSSTNTKSFLTYFLVGV